MQNNCNYANKQHMDFNKYQVIGFIISIGSKIDIGCFYNQL